MGLGIWLVTGADGRFHVGAGDPTLLGWLACAGYLGAAVVSLGAHRSSRYGARTLASAWPEEARNQRALSFMWLGLCVLMLVLGVNKQLDLQTLFTEVARDAAKAHGWYSGRRVVQLAFLVGMTLFGGLLTVVTCFALRRVLGRIALVLLGLLSIGAYVLLRAATFSHFVAPNGPVARAPYWWLELAGIALVTVAALRGTVPWQRASA